MSEVPPRVAREDRGGVQNPCYQCGERSPGCHGKCAKYKAYRAARDEQLARQHVIRDNDMAYDLYRRGRYPQIRRARRGRGDA